MRIMTFNIQHAFDYQNKKVDIGLFIDKIKGFDVDICGLNEVRGDGPLENYTDQTNKIADGLGYNRYFGEAIKVKGTSPYGNAIVSKLPLKSVETFRIPDPEKTNEINRDGEPVHYESRIIIKAVFEENGKDFCVFVTHMGLALSERKNAVETLCGLIDETEMPVILMGDFNSTPDEAVLLPLFERLEDTDKLTSKPDAPTYASYDPSIKIDYILYRGLKCCGAKTVEEIISDHFPIIAEFELN